MPVGTLSCPRCWLVLFNVSRLLTKASPNTGLSLSSRMQPNIVQFLLRGRFSGLGKQSDCFFLHSEFLRHSPCFCFQLSEQSEVLFLSTTGASLPITQVIQPNLPRLRRSPTGLSVTSYPGYSTESYLAICHLKGNHDPQIVFPATHPSLASCRHILAWSPDQSSSMLR